MPSSCGMGVQPRGSTTELGHFRRRAQLPACCTDLEVAGVGEDLVLAMGGHQGAIAGATLWEGEDEGEEPWGEGGACTNGAGQGHPRVCRGWWRMGSKGKDKLCMLCRKGEDCRLRHGALHGV